MKRRDAIRSLSFAGAASVLGSKDALAEALAPKPTPGYTQAMKGLPPLKITNIKTIMTAPNRIRLVVVKVETSEPGLVGWGCATFTQRALVVKTAIDEYLKPFLIGRNVDEIEDIWQSSYMSSYWRNGPVLFNAMSGVDIALWDIKGKRANMPLYQLLGGKVRHGADCYFHAAGKDFAELSDRIKPAIEQGFRHVRIQSGVEGMATYGAGGANRGTGASAPANDEAIGPTNPRDIWESAKYARMVPRMFEAMRKQFGEDVELLHDIHERVTLQQGIQICKDVEQFKPFFIEDPFPPEDNDHFKLLRQQCSTPLAMGEIGRASCRERV